MWIAVKDHSVPHLLQGLREIDLLDVAEALTSPLAVHEVCKAPHDIAVAGEDGPLSSL